VVATAWSSWILPNSLIVPRCRRSRRSKLIVLVTVPFWFGESPFVSCVHPFDLAFDPLRTVSCCQRSAAHEMRSRWALSPPTEFASSKFHFAGQRLEVQTGAAAVGVRLLGGGREQTRSKTTRGNQCG
jgi:hypothetical protein